MSNIVLIHSFSRFVMNSSPVFEFTSVTVISSLILKDLFAHGLFNFK